MVQSHTSKRTSHKWPQQPPPLDTSSHLAKSSNKVRAADSHHGPDAQSTSSEVTFIGAMSVPTPSSAATMTTPTTTTATTPTSTCTAPWSRSKRATFKDDLPSFKPTDTTTAPSSFSPAYSTCTSPMSNGPGVLLQTEGRSRTETKVPFCAASNSPVAASIITNVTFHNAAPAGNQSNKFTAHRYASIFPPPRPSTQTSPPLSPTENSSSVSAVSATSGLRQLQLAQEINRCRTIDILASTSIPSPALTESTTAGSPTTEIDNPSDSAAKSSVECGIHEKKTYGVVENESKTRIVSMKTLHQHQLPEAKPDKEAVEIFDVLGARLLELEQDCKDRAQVSMAAQDMDHAHQKEQTWIEQTEDAIRWATFALEDILLSPVSPSNDKCGNSNDKRISDHAKSPIVPERKSRSEGMLSTLTVPAYSSGTRKSDSACGGNDKPVVLSRLSLASRTRRQLSCSSGQMGARIDNENRTSFDRQGSRKRHQPNRGLVVNTKTSLGLDTTYKCAIMTALRHLNSIGPAPSQDLMQIGSAKSLKGIGLSCSKDGLNPLAEQPVNHMDTAIKTTRSRTYTATPDGLVGSRRWKASPTRPRCLSTFSAQPGSGSLVLSKTRLQPSHGSLPTLSKPNNPSALSLSAASMQATLSSSSQSLQTDLGGCLMDERVYLKQHIQALERLRLQDQARYQTLEQGHNQLISDLERFSKELLGSTNELTCAQACLVEAWDLTMMTLKACDRSAPDSEDIVDGLRGDVKGNGSRQKGLIVASCKELSASKDMVEQGIRKIRKLAGDCVGITELARVQAKAQTELANDQDIASTNTSSSLPIAARTGTVSLDAPEEPSPCRYSGQASTRSTVQEAIETKSTPVFPVQKATSMFVDGIGFQEFESHLASLRTTLGATAKRSIVTSTTTRNASLHSATSSPANVNVMTTPFMKRVLTEDIYPCLLLSPRSPSKPSGGWMNSLLSSSSLTGSLLPLQSSFPMSYGSNPLTPWLQRLLSAMEGNACEIEQWRNTSNRDISLSGTHSKQVHNRGPSTTDIANDAHAGREKSSTKVPCCLCGIARLCEFRLRILENVDCPSICTNNGISSSKKKAHQRSSLHTDTRSTSSQNQNHAPYPSAYRRANDIAQEYHPLDRFCRNRIVAVCDFYMFLAHLRQGLHDHQSNLELFRRAIMLRQQMACARIGSTDIVRTQMQAQPHAKEPVPLSLALIARE